MPELAVSDRNGNAADTDGKRINVLGKKQDKIPFICKRYIKIKNRLVFLE